MPSLTIKDIPKRVHDKLRQLAAARGQTVEVFVRELLIDLAHPPKRGGIDFEKLDRNRRALGLTEDGPEWTEAMDDPALSFEVLGLKRPRRKA